MQYDNYASLLSTIQDAWHGHYSLPHLTQTLTTYQSTIARLTEPQPVPQSRQRVEAKQFTIGDAPVDLRDSGPPGTETGRKTVDYVLHTSQLLQLDEVETVRLIHTAYAAAATAEAVQPLSERIMRLYYARRYNLYVSVLDLVLMYENPSFPAELLLPINQYVSALLAPSSGLLSHVLSLIAALTTQLLSSLSSSSAASLALTTATAASSNLTAAALLPHRIQELSHLCSLLLAISRKHPPTAAEGTQLIATLQSLSTLATQQQQQQQQSTADTTATTAALLPLTPELDTARRVCYSLLTALLSSLSVKLAAVQSSLQPDTDISAFVTALQSEGDKQWTSINFNAAWFLCWSLFLRRLKPVLPSLAVDDAAVTNTLLMALSSDVGLVGVVYREWLSTAHSTAVGRVSAAPVGWERREDVSEVWTELYGSLLLHAGDEVELMRDEEAMGDDSNFYYLLLSLSTLCQQSERNVSLLWSLDQTTHLIQSCLDQPTSALLASPLLYALVSLLTSLTLDRSADYGLRVWELLNDSASLSWHTVFSIFDQVARLYLPLPPASLQQTVAQPANVITADQSALLCALLSVLTAVVLSSMEVQSLLLGSQGAQYKPLDRLFALLGCRVDTVLKSAVLDAINALCAGERHACVDVWERMERAGMLAREDGTVAAVGGKAGGSGGGAGVWYDVEEVESVQRRYMLTIAFARLVLTLLSSAPLPSPSLSHYLSFLTHHLFLSLSDRQYERPIERWKLTETCLAIAALCIESSSPTTPSITPSQHYEDTTGLSLVRDLLQGRELLVKLLETLSRCYQLLEAAASTTVTPLASMTAEGGEHVSVLERGETEAVRYVEGSMVAVLRVLWLVMSAESEWMEVLKADSSAVKGAGGGRLYSLSSLLFGHGQEALVIAHATAYVEGGGSVVGRVMSERERRRRREREEELEAWKGAAEEREEKEKRMAEEGTVDDRDSEEDEGGYIPYYCTLLLHHLATTSPSRLSNLLLASHLAPDISRSLASLLTSTQLPSHASQPTEASRTHQARIEAVRLLREGVVDGGLGLVLLGFDVGVNGESGHGRLELSDRRFALDAIIELVQKPRSVTLLHTAQHSTQYTCGEYGERYGTVCSSMTIQTLSRR